MDSNNWWPPQDDAQPPPIDGGDWRSQLQPDYRQRIVNKIMETLKRHLPFSGQDGLQELKQIAIRFEEKIYSAATSQSDYLRKISLKILTMESKSQNQLPNAIPSNSAGVSRNPQDPASQNMQSQVHMQNQSVPHQMVPNQSQPRQQIPGMQPNQQQPNQSVLQQHQQPFSRQQQPQQPQTIQQQQQQQQVLGQQPNAGNMQQSQLIGQQSHSGNMQQNQLIGQQHNSGNMQQIQMSGQQTNSGNMQQSQLIGQQSNISDIQQQQQQRLLGQQNNISNLPSQQPTNQQNMQQQQQQHFMGQQNNLQNMHQQQLGHQSHVGGQQVVGTQSGNTSMLTNQHSLHMGQQTKAPAQQQSLNAASILSSGGQQQQQSQSQQQLMSQLQSQPAQLQQQLGMQQQPNYLQHNMPRMQNMNTLLQPQNLIDQKLFQSQRATQEAPSTSLDSTAQTSSANGGNWQEEVYQKIKSMKDLYYADFDEMHQKISFKLQQHDSQPQQQKIDQIEKLRVFKHMLERLMQVLLISKNNILPIHREKLPSFEKQIVSLLNSNRPRKPAPPGQQAQNIVPQPHSTYSQIPQSQSLDGGVNPQMQSGNFPGSVGTVQQNSAPSLQHGSVSSLSALTSQQNISSY